MRQNGAKAWWSKVRGRLMARAGQAQGVWGVVVVVDGPPRTIQLDPLDRWGLDKPPAGLKT